MGQPGFLALWANGEGRGLSFPVCATLTSARLAGFLFWNSRHILGFVEAQAVCPEETSPPPICWDLALILYYS